MIYFKISDYNIFSIKEIFKITGAWLSFTIHTGFTSLSG
jgi:hypothetical protein